jgi:hypothetical protein
LKVAGILKRFLWAFAHTARVPATLVQPAGVERCPIACRARDEQIENLR